ncbi:phosphotransferase enzyme family protein [Bacillus salitolerans]|uniref:Phosphotransferase enzyme family protein n=1 Tax=Bacillus salitolerans TaxID=1437434 RepID=A0ABW4LWV6_9BACI
MSNIQSKLSTKDEELLQLAKLTLDRYEINVKEVFYLVEETNIFFKVMDQSGNSYALKLFQEESSTLEDNLAEIFMINLVTKNSNISLPSVIQAKDGSYVQFINSRRLALYTWLEGDDFSGKESDELFIKFGELTAQLHQSTYGVSIPDTVSPKRWDKVFYYNGETAVYKNEEYKNVLTAEYYELMDKIIPFLDKALLSYYQKNEQHIQLIHADLNPWNVKVYEDELRILDFEEALLGLPVHDISIMLYYYDYEENIDFDRVKKLYFQGYEKVCPLPSFTDYDIDLLMTARRINFLNYILLLSDNPESFITTNIQRVNDFINKYNIQLP